MYAASVASTEHPLVSQSLAQPAASGHAGYTGRVQSRHNDMRRR